MFNSFAIPEVQVADAESYRVQQSIRRKRLAQWSGTHDVLHERFKLQTQTNGGSWQWRLTVAVTVILDWNLLIFCWLKGHRFIYSSEAILAGEVQWADSPSPLLHFEARAQTPEYRTLQWPCHKCPCWGLTVSQSVRSSQVKSVGMKKVTEARRQFELNNLSLLAHCPTANSSRLAGSTMSIVTVNLRSDQADPSNLKELCRRYLFNLDSRILKRRLSLEWLTTDWVKESWVMSHTSLSLV